MSGTVLYTPQVLALATGLASYPFDPDAALLGEARAPTCGSSIKLSLAVDVDGAITTIGLAAHACAIGQASAMVLAEAAQGRTGEDLAAADLEIANWLAGGLLPNWPGFAVLEPAHAYPARHGAIRLPWRAAVAALASVNAGG